MAHLSPQEQQALTTIIPQLFILGFDEENTPQEKNLGGVIAFDNNLLQPNQPKNIIDPPQIQQLNQRIEQNTPHVFRAIDCEGGLDWTSNDKGQRIRYGVNRLHASLGFEPTLCAQQIAALVQADQIQRAEQACQAIAQLIKASGFNLTFAPVVDITHPTASIIAQMGRSFSKNPALIIQCAQLFINACQQQGIQTALKHYPGHGSACGDSHLGITDITNSFNPKELEPYAALATSCGMVMSGHLIHKEIDHLPASISKIWLDRLRTDYDFKGVIITDDLQMEGLQTFIKELYHDPITQLTDQPVSSFILQQGIIHAINAGNDMLIIGNQLHTQPQLPEFCFKTVLQAVIDKKISMQRLLNAYSHICHVKPHIAKQQPLSTDIS